MKLWKYKTREDKQTDVCDDKNSVFYWIDFGSKFYNAITSKWPSQETNPFPITNHSLHMNYNFWASLAGFSKEHKFNIYKTKNIKAFKLVSAKNL